MYSKDNEPVMVDSEDLIKNFASMYELFQIGIKKKEIEFSTLSDKMEILFISKFPPTLGGVATQEYWRARQLVKEGYKVRVITNSIETATSFKLETFENILNAFNFEDEKSGGLLKTYFTEPSFNESGVIAHHHHIPMDKMSQSKLFGMASKVIKKYNSSVIISGYLEPYGSAASELSNIFKIPLIQHFAGSDIERLSTIYEIGERFKQVFNQASLIITTWDNVSRLISLGVSPMNICPYPPPTILPEDLFYPSKKQKKKLKTAKKKLIFGVYGKYSNHKNIEHIIEAVKGLKKEFYSIELKIIISNSKNNDTFKNMFNYLEEDIILSKGIPPWEVPNFIKSCDAIFMLESNFPIKIHAPITPLEVAMCGTYSIFSREMFNKIRLKGFYEGVNCEVIEDGTNVENIISIIKKIYSYSDLEFDISEIKKDNLYVNSWSEYKFNIQTLYNKSFQLNYVSSSIPYKMYIIYNLFSLTYTYLKHKKQKFPDRWIILNNIKDSYLKYGYDFSENTDFIDSDDIILKDIFGFETSVIESKLLAEESLDCDNINNNFFKQNSLSEVKYKVKLNYKPKIIRMRTNLVDQYYGRFKGNLELKIKAESTFLITTSNGFNTNILKINEEDVRLIEGLSCNEFNYVIWDKNNKVLNTLYQYNILVIERE